MPLLVLVSGLVLVACGDENSGRVAANSATPQPFSSAVRPSLDRTTQSVAPGTPLTVTGDSDGKEISLAPGRRLEVSLAANPSTGYQWELDALDPAVLEQTGDPEYRSAPGAETAVGVGGASIWHFVAVAPGRTRLRLGYARPWEPGIEPAQRFTLEVTVGN
ncbi:protease inhibitor I42 family protein [Nocardia wallacei]|uniref:protease inhibitor I42 family protein n=1 Tax=Nocardia wallacei TaxID=480035 RepID=UPI002455CF1E|nr:protease inhibitor I42 family protein [Nocardia wallacei]